MKELQEKLYQEQSLTQSESLTVFKEIISGNVSDIDITSLLIALKIKGESPEEVAGAAEAMRSHAVEFPKYDYLAADSCGTGGSGKNTVNLSTMVAVLMADFGLPMVKHGNRSVSSKCGSADILDYLNYPIDLTPRQAKQCLDETQFCFLFAPQYHPGVGNVMPVRNQLKTRTIFNLLGPLVNPAMPKYQLMGVYSADMCEAAAETLRLSGCESAMVVNSNGYDEITLHSATDVSQLKENKITNFKLTNENFGLPTYPAEAISGRSPEDNIQVFKRFLAGNPESQRDQAIIDTVAANAAALLVICNKAPDLKTAVTNAKERILSGRLANTFEKIVAYAQSLKEKGAQ